MNIELAKNPYYKGMLDKGRLIPFFKGERLVCFFTFYINNDESRYVNSDPWEILDDNPNGYICYISQLWTDKEYENRKLSYEIWHRFKNYIKANFPSVKIICWNRYKNGRVKSYKEKISGDNIIENNFQICRECGARCCNIITVLLKNNRTPEEEDDVQLILAHQGTHFQEQEGTQYIEIESKCKFLNRENECSIYDKRFNLCRRYECGKIKKEMSKCQD